MALLTSPNGQEITPMYTTRLWTIPAARVYCGHVGQTSVGNQITYTPSLNIDLALYHDISFSKLLQWIINTATVNTVNTLRIDADKCRISNLLSVIPITAYPNRVSQVYLLGSLLFAVPFPGANDSRTQLRLCWGGIFLLAFHC